MFNELVLTTLTIKCSSESATEKDVLKRLKELGLDHPLKDAGIKSADKKWVDIQRKHDVLFIKGDQVAVVLKG